MHMVNIKSKEDVVHYVNEVGFLPFFRNHISGFSLEDMVESKDWYDGFSDKEIVDFLMISVRCLLLR